MERTTELSRAVIDGTAAPSREDEVVVDDAALLLAPTDELSAREVVRRGGVMTLLTLTALNVVDDWDRAAFQILAPDIQETLGASTLVLTALNAIAQPLVVAGSIAYGMLADRTRRRPLVIACSAWLWAVFAALTALVQSSWQLGGARLGTGLVKANQPVDKSLLADVYPIAGRARILATYVAAQPVGAILGPLLAGLAVTIIGGDEAWRIAFPLLAVPAVVLGFVVATLRDPGRGTNEQEAVFGARRLSTERVRISVSAAMARLKKVRTYYAVMIAIGIVGVGQVSVPIVFNLLLDEEFGLSAFERGAATATTAVGTVVGLVLGARSGDRRFRREPTTVLRRTGAGIAAYGVAYAVAIHLPGGVLPVIAMISVAHAGLAYAAAPAEAVIASVTPHRLRGMGFAMRGVYGAVGGIAGALLLGLFADTWGEKAALTIALPPACLIAGAIVAGAARHLHRDLAMVVAELRDDLAEQERRDDPDRTVPLLQVSGLDVSYGQLQVLFGVELEVQQGEILALLGTNGAGKSTVLRAVSGLAVPDRGAIRWDGELITFTTAEERVGQGIIQVRGGRGVFPSLTVRENLVAASYTSMRRRDEVAARAERALTLFPRLHERLGQAAGSLSGGEQQMLAIAQALMHEPRLLLIDELSLGLAPVVVHELLDVVHALRDEGITFVIVEQSVNLALEIADRAVFLEKGHVRFSGPAKDLLERGDLVRAVFLGEQSG